MTNISIAYFAPDATQGSVTKRIVSFQEHGFDVISFTFRRDRQSVLTPVCENVDLGVVPDRRYLYRAFRTIAVFGRLWKARERLRASKIYYARMLDSLLIALLAKRLFNRSAHIYYEVCDIRRVMMDEGVSGRIARWLERQALARCKAVVVNSPAFTTEYFAARQGYFGETFTLENKVYAASLSAVEQARARNLAEARTEPDPLRIAWFGNLDCPETWGAIKAVAARFPQKVSFYLRGYPIIPEDDIRQAERDYPNIEFGGPFNNRTDLEEMYRRVDAVLGLDLMNREGNSWWLLPNSLYEAGAYGRPLICSSDTETAKRVSSTKTGWVLPEPIEKSFTDFLDRFRWNDHALLARNIAASAVATYAGQDQVGDLARLMISDLGDRTSRRLHPAPGSPSADAASSQSR